jgi:hypothetical protein
MKVTMGNIRSRDNKQPFACEVNETFSKQQSVKNVKFGNLEELGENSMSLYQVC